MIRYLLRLLAAISFYIWFSSIASISLCQQSYTVTDLGTLGGLSSGATGINTSGQVVGSSLLSNNSTTHAFLWENNEMTDLLTLGGTNSYGYGINNSRQVVGSSLLSNNSTTHAFLWENSMMTDLGTLGGMSSFAFGINSSSQVVGFSEDAGVNGHAFLWENGVMTDLGTLGGGNSEARGINDSGQVVGGSELPDYLPHAFLWDNGTMTDLGTLGGLISLARAINSSGQVVGDSYLPGGGIHAFLWESGVMIDLGTLGGVSSSASGINSSGQVVGYSDVSSGNGHAFLWEDGVMIDLNSIINPSSGWILSGATSINNKGEIVGTGFHDGQTRAFLLAPFLITHPQSGELWIAGERDTIKWNGGVSGQQLNIKFSTNGGNTFTQIASGIHADSGHYVWNIPKDILSTKMKIKISVMTDTTIFAVSDTFKTKGYILTKYYPNGNYKPYSMYSDPWGFSNEQQDFWPFTWYSRFDYQGTDPFTNRQYSQWQGNFLFANSRSYDFPDWPSFVNTFGTGACYVDIFLGIYSLTAQIYWESKKDQWDGSCFGIAISNFLAWENKESFRNRYPNFPNFTNPIEVFSSTNTIPVINELWTHQLGNPHRNYRSNVGLNKTPTQTLNDLKQMLTTEGAPVQTLSFNNNNGSGGHAILSYKVEKDTTNPNIFYAYVYDNSFPDSLNARIVFNTTANGGNGSWDYNNWSGWGGNQWIYLRDPVSTYLTNPTINKPAERQSPFILDGSILQICPSINASVIIQDASGNITGYFNDSIQCDIPNSYPLIVDNGSETPPYGYELPADNYSIVTNNFTRDTIKAFFFTGNKTFSYKRSGAIQSQTDRFYFDGGVSVANPDQEIKEVSLLNIINETTQEKLFAIRSLELVQNDSIKIENPDDEKLKLISYGSAKNYDIELNFVSENQLGRFGDFNIPLLANTSHTFLPDWSDITNNELLILVDVGNDGTIDDTLYIDNTVDVKDEGILLTPTEYNLAQNYPNPFNPSTTIRYSISQRSNVVLKVYDILGNEVATLVNEEKERGVYTVNFDASQLASGVYFYKLQAAGFVETKKMILLK